MNTLLIRRRLGWYGLAWLGGFLLVLLIGLAGHYLFNADIIAMADLMIPAGLLLMVLALAGVVVRDLLSRQSIATRLVILLLALILVLPLLWSPVAASVAAAWVADRSIEYSAAYAQFRITISQLLYPVVEAVSSGAAFELTWKAFQLVGSLVGFFASLLQIVAFFRRLLSAGSVTKFVDEMTAPPEGS